MAVELAVLRWIHIIAMVYWLGGEWGVFQTSRNVINFRLPMDERRRHMETAYRIDILARTGIILLLPLGLHMGNIWGVQPYGGPWLVAMWVLFGTWLGLCWAAFVYRETDRGILLTLIDEKVRYFLIPALIIACIASWMGYGPFESGTGQLWFTAKIFVYAFLLVIGLKLRFIMREWTVLFRRLAEEGESKEIEDTLEASLAVGRKLAYVYWIGIATVAFFGAVKPF